MVWWLLLRAKQLCYMYVGVVCDVCLCCLFRSSPTQFAYSWQMWHAPTLKCPTETKMESRPRERTVFHRFMMNRVACVWTCCATKTMEFCCTAWWAASLRFWEPGVNRTALGEGCRYVREESLVGRPAAAPKGRVGRVGCVG